MQIAIVTINYNSAENTIKLLESLKNQTNKEFEVIVVDNNSNDVNRLMDYQTSKTNIIYLKNDRNLGYSGGNNIGIKKALENGADWILLLNNDTWFKSSFMAQLRVNLSPSTGSWQESKEDLPAVQTGIIGLAIDEGDRTAFAGKIEWLKPTLPHITNSDFVSQNYCYAIGGAMLIHKSVFDKMDLLDENYFLYFEDADFSLRARKVGVPVSFLSDIKIYHSVSASTRKLGSPLLLRYHYRNAFYFNSKNGPWHIKLLVWPWSWIVAIKQIIKILAGKNKEQSVAILKGVGDWYAGRMGKLYS